MALALVIGVAGAFTTKAHSSKIENNKKLITFNWAPCDASGNPTGPAEYAGNSDGASIHFGCSGKGAFCARAYNGDGTPAGGAGGGIFIKHN